MPDGVLLDTSFLISFVDANRKHHAVAVQFFRHFVDEGIPMFLSTIVASEFHMGQAVTDLPLDAIITLPFNFNDAVKAAELDFTLFKGEPNVPRAALKDDFKLLGQAKANDIAFLITEDGSLHKFCQELKGKSLLPTRPIKLEDGFSKSYFDPAGQHDLDETLPHKG